VEAEILGGLGIVYLDWWVEIRWIVVGGGDG